jgi:hypothetical protein
MNDILERAAARGLSASTVIKRIRSGWIEADLLTPVQPPTHSHKARTPAAKTHPWKTWKPGRYSRRDRRERGQ